MEYFILICVGIGVIILRAMLKDSKEAAGQNICPICHTKMDMNIFGRYRCPRCNYHEPSGY